MKMQKKGVIVDANVFYKFANINHIDSKPIHKRLKNQKLKLVYGNDKKSLEELKKNRVMFNILKKLRKRGAVYKINSKEKKQELDNNNRFINNKVQLKSDDTHIIAVALTESKVRLLFSDKDGDKKLEQDFTNNNIINNPKGKVYKDASHAHLLD